MQPIIAFGQQPNGILPKRYFVAKLNTARRLQEEIGGRIVWFVHDSDHDAQETAMKIPYDQHPKGYIDANFTWKNKIQRKYSPLFAKEVGGLDELKGHLQTAIPDVVDMFSSVNEQYAGAFCVEMYKRLGLVDDIDIVCSGSPEFREAAENPEMAGNGWFADVEYEGELVRAMIIDGRLKLHQGGPSYIDLGPATDIARTQLSAGRDARFDWMQSVLKATYYITGRGEEAYLAQVQLENPPELIPREDVENSGLAWLPDSGL